MDYFLSSDVFKGSTVIMWGVLVSELYVCMYILNVYIIMCYL